jgi:hypothetical protein
MDIVVRPVTWLWRPKSASLAAFGPFPLWMRGSLFLRHSQPSFTSEELHIFPAAIRTPLLYFSFLSLNGGCVMPFPLSFMVIRAS